MGGISKEKYIESLFTILKGRLPSNKEKLFFNSRFDISTTPLENVVETVTGTAVDNTDPLNPVINVVGTGGGSEVTLAQFNQLSNTVNLHINDTNNPHTTKGDNIPDGLDLVTIFNTGLI